jgi:hypothetical protein
MTQAERCPGCGAIVAGGRAGCQALWDGMSIEGKMARDLAFDAYCMQHLETYCRSAKSYAAHLTRLCCGIEYGGEPQVYRAIQHWLNGKVNLEKPALLAFLGELTIADVSAAQTAEDRARITQAWAQSVWSAYAPQQDLARGWICQALAR